VFTTARHSALNLSQTNSIHNFLLYFFNILLNIISPPTSRSSKLFFSSRFPCQNPVCISPLPHMCHILRPFHLHVDIWWAVQIIKLLITHFSPSCYRFLLLILEHPECSSSVRRIMLKWLLNTGCDALTEGQAAGFPQRREETKIIKPKDFILIEQSPSLKANNHSHDQNISPNLHDPILHDTVHTSLPLVPLLSQMNLPYNLKLYVYKIHFNIILPFNIGPLRVL